MEDFYMNNTSWSKSYNHTTITSDVYNYSNITSNDYNYSNITSNNSSDCDDDDKNEPVSAIYVLTWIIISIGLPLTLAAIYALYSLVRKDHVTPIYVINLLISDLIQLCLMIVEVVQTETSRIHLVYLHCVVASIGFMVCVAMERYLVVAWPLWYRFRRTIKSSVVVCVVAWVLPLVCVLPVYFFVDFRVRKTLFAIFFFLPLPLFMFFLGGTLRALSASISVPSEEKRRIVGCLVLVILNYMLLFLPSIILFLADGTRHDKTLSDLSYMFLKLSPLADLGLYVFMRKGTIDKILASVCCCRMDSDKINSSAA